MEIKDCLILLKLFSVEVNLHSHIEISYPGFQSKSHYSAFSQPANKPIDNCISDSLRVRLSFIFIRVSEEIKIHIFPWKLSKNKSNSSLEIGKLSARRQEKMSEKVRRQSKTTKTNYNQSLPALLTFSVLFIAWISGFASRLFAVIRFESIIHEFDPWWVLFAQVFLAPIKPNTLCKHLKYLLYSKIYKSCDVFLCVD